MRTRTEIINGRPDDPEEFSDYLEQVIDEFEDLIEDLRSAAKDLYDEVDGIYKGI